MLSPAFIVSPAYGTRSSTALLVGRDGTTTLAERSFDTGGLANGEQTLRFRLDGSDLKAAS